MPQDGSRWGEVHKNDVQGHGRQWETAEEGRHHQLLPAPEHPDASAAVLGSSRDLTIRSHNNTVTITGDPDCRIYYTVDGSAPTAESLLYDGPFRIEAVNRLAQAKDAIVIGGFELNATDTLRAAERCGLKGLDVTGRIG